MSKKQQMELESEDSDWVMFNLIISLEWRLV
jgi:hypothetical protein